VLIHSQKGFRVGFTSAAALVSQLLEARDERRQLPPQAIRRTPPRGRQDGAKPGERRRSRGRRNHATLQTLLAPPCSQAPDRGPGYNASRRERTASFSSATLACNSTGVDNISGIQFRPLRKGGAGIRCSRHITIFPLTFSNRYRPK
jgi:hypothetical protein